MSRRKLNPKRILIDDIVVLLDSAPNNYYKQMYEGLLGVVIARRPRRGAFAREVWVRFQGMAGGTSVKLRTAWLGIVAALGDHTHSCGSNPIYDREPDLTKYPLVTEDDGRWRPRKNGRVRRPRRKPTSSSCSDDQSQ